MIFEESIDLSEKNKKEQDGDVDKRLGVDEGSQMQVVLGIVIYSLMGSDGAW